MSATRADLRPGERVMDAFMKRQYHITFGTGKRRKPLCFEDEIDQQHWFG